jgi:ribosomal protein S18 acetylase RimI-like enzyme
MNNDHASVIISSLDSARIQHYKALRLRALREHPDAFMETPEAFEARSVESIAERMRQSTEQGGFTLVAEIPGRGLVGTASLAVGSTPKDAHRGLIWGVYVAPQTRGIGIGQRLMREIIERASRSPSLRNLHLAVVRSNAGALRLYQSLGFTQYGLDIDALCVNGEFLSEVLMSIDLRFRNQGTA